jgi:hypothetical protein
MPVGIGLSVLVRFGRGKGKSSRDEGLEAGSRWRKKSERGLVNLKDDRHHDISQSADILDNGRHHKRDYYRSHVKPMRTDGQRDLGM